MLHEHTDSGQCKGKAGNVDEQCGARKRRNPTAHIHKAVEDGLRAEMGNARGQRSRHNDEPGAVDSEAVPRATAPRCAYHHRIDYAEWCAAAESSLQQRMAPVGRCTYGSNAWRHDRSRCECRKLRGRQFQSRRARTNPQPCQPPPTLKLARLYLEDCMKRMVPSAMLTSSIIELGGYADACPVLVWEREIGFPHEAKGRERVGV